MLAWGMNRLSSYMQAPSTAFLQYEMKYIHTDN